MTGSAMVTEKQKKEVIQLYRNKEHSIKEIMELVGIRSTTTIYKIVNSVEDMPRHRSMDGVRISVTLDGEAAAILASENPRNTSRWVSAQIKRANPVRNTPNKK